MKILYGFWALVTIILVIYLVKIKKELRNISKQIEKNNGEYFNIHTNSLTKEVEDLIVKINFLYDENQRINAAKKASEEEIRQSISNMSHDLRTPLTSIMGYIQLIKEEEISPKEAKEYLDIIEGRTERLESLITSFYDLSRLNSSEYNFSLNKVNLSTVLCENIASYYTSFTDKGIEPMIEIEENTSLIISDGTAVNRIFTNLIGNMIKHGESFIKIALWEEESYIVTSFINGASMVEEDNINKLFDRFYTADKSRTGQNTGLGLAITRAFVEKLGNQIKATLTEGTFVIEIRWKK